MSKRQYCTQHPDTGKAGTSKRKKILVRAVALALGLGSVALPVSAYAGSISGYKFLDTLDITGNGVVANGVRDDEETLLDDHMIILKQNGRKLKQQLTDDNGYYSFPNLSDGKYQLSINIARGACSTAPKEDNNSTHSRNITYDITIKNGQNRQVDVGIADCKVVQPAVTPEQACANPSIISVSSGRWDDKVGTWSTTTWPMTERSPKAGDRVKVNSAHTITMPQGGVNLGTGSLCNEGSITSSDNTREHGTSDIEIHSRVINNRGKIIGKKGVDGNCSVRGVSASNIMLFASSVFVNETTNSSNEALISTGKGGTSYTGVCPEHRKVLAGNGGGIEIKAGIIKNYANVFAGDGGNAGISHHAAAVAGEGGYILVSSDNVNDSVNEGEISTGTGGWSEGYRNGKKYSKGGNVTVNLGDFNGEIVGAPGSSMWGDPIHLNLGANLKIRDFENVNLYTDEGGTIDFTKVNENTFSNVKVISIATKSLNGEGGSIDLRGISGKIFKAASKVEIFADDIQLDAGVNINDLIEAPEVVVEKGKLLYHVQLSSDPQIAGEPGSTVTIPINVFNASPKDDSYTFAVTDSEGWTLGTIAEVAVKGLQQATVKLAVTLPNERAATSEITITATSKTKSEVTSEAKIHAMVNAGEDGDGDGHPDVLDHFPDNADEWLDTDGDGIGNNADTDDDNDGMLDTWENQYEGLVSVIDDANDDIDEDGFTNGEESQADTNPVDASSKPQVPVEQPAEQCGLPYIDIWDSTNPNALTKVATRKVIETAENGQQHYNYHSSSAHPACVNTKPYAANTWMHQNTNDGDLSFGFVFSEDAGRAPLNDAKINFRIVGSTTDPYVAQSDDAGEAVETPAGSNAFLGNYLYGDNTDGMAVSGIGGEDWTVIVDSVDFGAVSDWFFSGGTCNVEDDFSLQLGHEYRITPACHTPSGQPVVVDETVTYTASGILSDQNGNPIPGTTISVNGKTAVTNANGYWQITGLTEGRYDVTATKAGYTFPAKDCEVGNGQDCEVNIKAGSLLSLDIKTEPRRPNQGESVTYIMTVHNQGTQTATGITLDAPVPDEAELISIGGDQNVNCNGTICTLGDLAVGESTSVSMTVANRLSTQLVNTLTLRSNEYPTEEVEKKVYVVPYFSVERASKTQVVTKGDEFDVAFRVAANEHAPEAARNIQFKTELARGYLLQGVTGADCDTAGLPQITCNMGDMAPGESRDVTFDLKLDDFYALWASHRAVVKADNYPSDGAAVQTRVYLEGDADVIVAIDVTGSMQDELAALETVTAKLQEALVGKASPMMAVVSFRDDIRLEAASTHLDEVVNAIGKLEAKGGGACPEASYEAMMLAVKHAKEGATLILVTDAPPYPGTNMNPLINAINKKGIDFILVRTETMCSPVDEWKFQE